MKNQDYNKKMTMFVLQIMAIYNAIVLGWEVKKISQNSYELSKKVTEVSNLNLHDFIDSLLLVNN